MEYCYNYSGRRGAVTVMGIGHRDWSTLQEIEFVKSLGFHSKKRSSTERKKRLLENYIDAANKRKNWGNIDYKKVIARAVTELAQFQEEEWKEILSIVQIADVDIQTMTARFVAVAASMNDGTNAKTRG